MNDPKRWLDEGGGATFEERELLDAGRRAALPSALRKRLWIGVATGAAGLGAASEAAGAVGAAATGGAGLGGASEAVGALGAAAAGKGVISVLVGSAAAKGVVAVAIVGAAGLGIAELRSPTKPAAVSTAGATSSPEEPRAAEPSRAREENAAVAAARDENPSTHRSGPAPLRTSPKSLGAMARGAEARSSPAAVAANEDGARAREAPVDQRSASRLREESAVILAIRRTLLAGDAAEALRMLDRARAAFPNGALVEEREALAVRALVASGQNELARTRGEAFLRAFPRSPHASEVRAVLGP